MTQNDDQAATPPWDAARVNLTSKELAPGVFAVLPDDVFDKDHVATTAGFVIGERSVLVIESMLNGDLASQLIGLVRQATTKPISSWSTPATTGIMPTETTCSQKAP